MHGNEHGPAVAVVLLSLLAGLFLAGCGTDRGPGGEQADEATSGERPREEPLSPPQMRAEVLDRQTLNVPPELANLRPVEVLPADERMTLYRAMGPLRLRVARPDGSTLAEIEARSGDVLVVDRRAGVRLGGNVLVRGPLEEQAVYSIFALPVGGVQQEATRTLIRPETAAEREARLAQEAEQRRQQEAATRPSTQPSGG